MPSPILQDLSAKVSQAVGAMQSAVVLINGFKARLDAAIAEATRLGATAEELAPVQAEAQALGDSAQQLAEAVAANP